MKNQKYKIQKLFWESTNSRRDPEHPVIKAFVEPKVKYVNSVILNKGEKEKLSLLDIGCGNGFFTYYLKNFYHTVSLDFSEQMLKQNNCKFKICASADKLPFHDNYFDITFCSNLMHHLDNPENAIREMKRVSRKYIILSEPNRNNPLMFIFGLLNKLERGTLKFSLNYMKTLVSMFGLKVISASNLGIVLPNKTPNFLLPLLKKVDGEFPCAFYNILISEKEC